MEKLAKIFSISTWILLLSFFIFLVKIGFSVCLQTDDFVLLNSYKIHSWTDVYTQFPYNFRFGSYSLFLFLFGEIHPSKVHLFIGFYYLALFLFSVSVFYKTITFFLIYFKQSHFDAVDRWKISLYFFLFLFLIYRIFKITTSVQSNFSRLFMSGFIILLVVQIFINIGMNLGLSPIVGISLPLVSYGGSGLIATFLGLGILQSMKAH